MHTTPEGQFYTIGGLAHSSPGRPVQPKTSIVLDEVSKMRPHGALLLAGQSTLDRGFNPVIARPVPTATLKLAEPEFVAPAWFPEKLFAINRLQAVEGPGRLVIVPAQFRGDQDEGLQRRFTQMRFEVTYSDSDDWMPPAIWQAKGEVEGDTMFLSVAAADASDVERVLVTYADAGGASDGGSWESLDLAYNEYTEQWEGTLSGLEGAAVFFIQAMDTAGNVTVSGNKGHYFEPESTNVYLPVILNRAAQ